MFKYINLFVVISESVSVIKHDDVLSVKTSQYSLIENLYASDFIEINDDNFVKNVAFKFSI